MTRRLAILLCGLALGGCAIFPGKPPLPKRAALDSIGAPRRGTDFAALVASAEVLYFPTERAAFGARSEPSAQIVDALRQTASPFAIGWEMLDLSQQALLDQLPGTLGAAREAIIARLEFSGTGRAREHLRSVLRDERLAAVPHLALRPPPGLIARIEAREKLTPEERAFLPRGYRLPRGGAEAHAAQLATQGPSDPAPPPSYRAAVAVRQVAAERIVNHFRGGVPGRLLVFLRTRDLEAGRGVPYYVAQKLPLRQVVVESDLPEGPKRKLLTGL